jgi:hypothetical protein
MCASLPVFRIKSSSFEIILLTTSRPLAVSVPGTSIGVDLTLGHLKQLLREPRRIEILGQNKIAHFQPDLAYYRTALIALFSSGGNGPTLFWAASFSVMNSPCAIFL